MNEFLLTRGQVQEKLTEITRSTQNKDAVKAVMLAWMTDKQCTPFEIQQILNDLTSYTEYLSLLN